MSVQKVVKNLITADAPADDIAIAILSFFLQCTVHNFRFIGGLNNPSLVNTMTVDVTDLKHEKFDFVIVDSVSSNGREYPRKINVALSKTNKT